VDSDLAEAIAALKSAFERRKLSARFGAASPELVSAIKTKLSVPRRYREFLAAADPLDVETRTPAERVRLIPATELTKEQGGFALNDSGEPILEPTGAGWRPSWVIVGHSALLGDPYFLDVSSPDPEGDCPVYTAMSGTETWKPRLCASSFALFVRILAIGMEVAEGFGDADVDVDDEQTFRDTLAPRLREYDPAAMKAGHWT
jgi:SMI1 / KNR4 family (SUKH-1)